LIITVIITHSCHRICHHKNVRFDIPPSAARFYSCCSSLMGRVCTGWVYTLYLYINLLSPFSYPNLPQHLPIWRRFRSASWKGMFFVSPLRKVNALLRYSPLPPPFIFRLPTSHGTDSYSFISPRFVTVLVRLSTAHISVQFFRIILTTAVNVVFVWSTQNLFFIYSATYYSVTATDALVCHEISRLTGEGGVMYLTIREISTIRGICCNNTTGILVIENQQMH
jgi:hypothetical protein